MTQEAENLLTWIERRGRVTRHAVLMLGPLQYRRLRRLCLAELMEAGYVQRVNGGWLEATRPTILVNK